MIVSLRPHHLLCILTYLGKGYTPAFVSNYSKIIRILNKGAMISLVFGPDDICQPMLNEAECHCHNESVRQRDAQAAADIGELLQGNALAPGPIALSADHIARLRHSFQSGTIRSACRGCEWFDLCTEIAQNDFRGCRLRPPLTKSSG